MNRTIQTTIALLIAITGISIAFGIPPAVQGQMEMESAMSESSLPTFYRGGEKVEPRMQEELPPEPMEEERSVFEEEAVEEMETTEAEVTEGTEVTEDTEVAEDAEAEGTEATEGAEESLEEESTKPAAPESLIVRIMRQMKYVIGAVGLALAGGFYWYISKPKATTEAPEASRDIPEKPKGNGDVAESSKRLEQALKAMENDK